MIEVSGKSIACTPEGLTQRSKTFTLTTQNMFEKGERRKYL